MRELNRNQILFVFSQKFEENAKTLAFLSHLLASQRSKGVGSQTKQ